MTKSLTEYLGFALAAAALSLATPWSSAALPISSPVTVKETDNDITLDNGIVAIAINRKGGSFSSLAYRHDGTEALIGQAGKSMYFDINCGTEGLAPDVAAKAPKAGYQWANIKSSAVVRNTPDFAEVVLTGEPATYCPFGVDLHFVMQRGESGYYAYAEFRHDASMAGGGIGQTRFVVLGSDVITDHVIDDARKGPVDRSPFVKAVSDATYLQKDGNVYCKYDNTAFLKNHYVHGMTGNGTGVWMVTPSNEYVNGGPIKQELTVHAGNTLLSMFVGGHFGGAGPHIAVGEPWTHIYGPVFVYLNKGANTDAMFADAKRQADEERAKWPYKWVNNPDYPVDRGTVSGAIHMTDGAPTKGATVVLAQPGSDWTLQGRDYEFWSDVDANGQFSISKVRPGTYALYAYGANQFEQFEADNVNVTAGKTTNLGTLDWKAVKHGTTLWQIGTPDRTSLEYRGGEDNWGPNGMRHYANYMTYPQAFPNDVTFVIGKSHEATDWNYAQWTWYCKKPYWSIDFTLPSQLTGTATMTVGIAASNPLNGHSTNTVIKVNGHEVQDLHLIKSGAAAYRSGGSDSQYQLKYVTFDASLLKPGDNEITLGDRKATPYPAIPAEAEGRTAYDGMSVGTVGAVMYDAIRLEVGN